MAKRYGSAAATTTAPTLAALTKRFEQKKSDETQRLRKKGWKLDEALRGARVRAAFDILSGDFVKLEAEPDEEPYDDSFIDTWTDQSEREREKYRKELWRRINNEGVWGIVSYWRPHPGASWEKVSDVWGFVGDDTKDNGYDDDLMRAALRKVARGTMGLPKQIALMGMPRD